MTKLNMSKSNQWYQRAKKVIPGGVNSPVRAFKSVGMDPVFIERGEGSKLFDVDGNDYIDYIQSWGPMILGHAPGFLVEGFEEHLKKGTSFGLPTALEVEMAELISELYPAAQMIRMVNSGTEATMSALRLARGFTGRTKIVKFEGCYHGHSDALLVKSGSGALTYGIPTSLGVPEDVVKDTLVMPYNDLPELRDLFEKDGENLACVIIEPVAGNMGVVAATKEFLEGVRALCTQFGALLIFDEVITGFRLALGGAAQYYGIAPDLVCFGKIIGGGLPVGAYGGREDIMQIVSPLGGVYQAGTLSGNPLALYMGHKVLSYLKNNEDVYDQINQKAIVLEKGLKEILVAYKLPYTVVREAAMVCLFFLEFQPTCYSDVAKCDTQAYGAFFRGMLQRGVLLPPAQYEGVFLSLAHSKEDLEKTLTAVRSYFEECSKIG